MQDAIRALALRRAGASTMEEFLRQRGLDESAGEMALMPYVVGYELWRVRPGDSFGAMARALGSSVQAIAAANPRLDPERLQVGTLVVVPLGFPVVPTDTPMSSQLLGHVLRGLQARYPMLDLDTIGTTEYGRPLRRARIGTGPRVVYYNAAHHANEWITATLVLALLETLAKAAAFGENLAGVDAAALLRQVTLYLVPMVDPDGVDLLTGGATAQEIAVAEAIAADYPAIPFPEGWKANLRGVDLNLNYPAQWDQARENKFGQGYTSPAPRDYVGPSPLSERESRAMFDTTEALDPDLTIAWHTQGQEIYWKFLDLEPEGARALGRQMAEASGYDLEEVPYASGFAGYKDWFIQDFMRPGYTVEAGLGTNPLPLEQLPDMLRDNLPIFLLGLTGGDPNYVEPQITKEAMAVQSSAPRRDRSLPPNQSAGQGLQPTWG